MTRSFCAHMSRLTIWRINMRRRRLTLHGSRYMLWEHQLFSVKYLGVVIVCDDPLFECLAAHAQLEIAELRAQLDANENGRRTLTPTTLARTPSTQRRSPGSPALSPGVASPSAALFGAPASPSLRRALQRSMGHENPHSHSAHPVPPPAPPATASLAAAPPATAPPPTVPAPIAVPSSPAVAGRDSDETDASPAPLPTRGTPPAYMGRSRSLMHVAPSVSVDRRTSLPADQAPPAASPPQALGSPPLSPHDSLTALSSVVSLTRLSYAMRSPDAPGAAEAMARPRLSSSLIAPHRRVLKPSGSSGPGRSKIIVTGYIVASLPLLFVHLSLSCSHTVGISPRRHDGIVDLQAESQESFI